MIPANNTTCTQCVHYHEDSEYDYCHMCVMEVDYFKKKAEYIDRQKTLDEMIKSLAISGPEYLLAAEKHLYDIVAQMPAENVRTVRTGTWVKDEDGCMVCSECGYPDEINTITGEFMQNNYCAGCGAEMTEAE